MTKQVTPVEEKLICEHILTSVAHARTTRFLKQVTRCRIKLDVDTGTVPAIQLFLNRKRSEII